MDLYVFGGLVVVGVVIALMFRRLSRRDAASRSRGGMQGPVRNPVTGRPVARKRPGAVPRDARG